MTDKKIISVVLDPDVVEQLAELQSKYRVFSRSELLREIINEGLKKIEKKKVKQ